MKSLEPGFWDEDKASIEWRNQKRNGTQFPYMPEVSLSPLPPPTNCIALPGAALNILK